MAVIYITGGTGGGGCNTTALKVEAYDGTAFIKDKTWSSISPGEKITYADWTSLATDNGELNIYYYQP